MYAIIDIGDDAHESDYFKIKEREFDSCLHFFADQIAQNVDYINAFEFFYCQIHEIICRNM